MKLLEEMSGIDLITPLMPLFDRGILKLAPEGELMEEPRVRVNTPWLVHSVDGNRQCNKHLDWYFRYYRLISKTCHGCYKLVVRPQTLAQLMKVRDIQLRQYKTLPCKCGIETRDIVPSDKYAAFWYCPIEEGLEEARKLWAVVQKQVKSETGLNVLLKKGCTEMEKEFGPSDTWVYGEAEQMLEDLLDTLFVRFVPITAPTPKVMIPALISYWIRHAWSIGDETVWQFAEKESFPAPPKDYSRGGLYVPGRE